VTAHTGAVCDMAIVIDRFLQRFTEYALSTHYTSDGR